MSLKLHTIVCSTRPKRVGLSVGQWFHVFATQHGKFETELVDLATFNLPLYDEPTSARAQQYTQEHTRRWSKSVAAADAYVFVAPEYNRSPTPALTNALDYLYHEWNCKPCAFVSYGGATGGVRSAQAARLHAVTLQMMPLPQDVTVPNVASHIDENSGIFTSDTRIDTAAETLLAELARWARALQTMRSEAA